MSPLRSLVVVVMIGALGAIDDAQAANLRTHGPGVANPIRLDAIAYADTVVLHVALIAGGEDPAGSRSGYVLCTSKGSFETEFATKVQARVGRVP